MSHIVEIVRAPAITAAVVRFHISADELPEIAGPMGRAFGTVMAELEKARVVTNGPAVACYQQSTDGLDVAAGFRVPATFTAPSGLERLDLGGVDAAHT